MPANNIHVLKDEEVEMLNGLFSYEVKDDHLLQTPVSFKRTTAYSINSSFSVRYKYLNKNRKVKIQAYTIKVWLENFKDKYTLFDVQNAINKLLVTYQKPDIKDISRYLSNPESLKIKIV